MSAYREEEAMPTETRSPRRTLVRRHRGIYYREGADGNRRYEISYYDSDGRRRWQTIEGGLQEAIDARDKVRGRKRRGERVAPTTKTLAEIADEWLAAQSQLRPRTREWYETALRVHVKPRLGRRRVAEIGVDDIARLIAEMREAGAAGWTIRGVLTPLGQVFSHAARRGLIAFNPIAKLEKNERPKVGRRAKRILDRDEIVQLLNAATDGTHTPYRTLLATAVFTGLRLGELLGLTWADVDLESGVVRVRKQLDRKGRRVEPKTEQAVRDVVMFPALAKTLREQKERAFGLGRARPTDLVFSGPRSGGPLNGRNVAKRGLDKAMERAGLGDDGRPKLRFHDLRHTFASLLIAQGRNVVYVSRQLGHADPAITLRVYADLFDRKEHAERHRDEMEAEYGSVLTGATEDAAAVVSLAAGS
jgi:integrase